MKFWACRWISLTREIWYQIFCIKRHLYWTGLSTFSNQALIATLAERTTQFWPTISIVGSNLPWGRYLQNCKFFKLVRASELLMLTLVTCPEKLVAVFPIPAIWEKLWEPIRLLVAAFPILAIWEKLLDTSFSGRTSYSAFNCNLAYTNKRIIQILKNSLPQGRLELTMKCVDWVVRSTNVATEAGWRHCCIWVFIND